MDFNKYCNCYSQPYGKISVECYDTILEAIHKHESRIDDKSVDSRLVVMKKLAIQDSRLDDKCVDSRLVIMKKFWPQFIQKIIVQNEFCKPVVFIPKLLLNINKNNE